MYTLLKPINVRRELLRRNIRIFSADDFIRIFKTSSQTTKYFLETQTQQHFLLRLKRGMYLLKDDLPAEEELANALYKPSYISFEYSLAYYHLLPEMPYTITCATTKPTRFFTSQRYSFSYRSIKKQAFTGYNLVKQNNKIFFIAEPEKAIVDYLYFVALNKSPNNERLIFNIKNSDKYDIGKLDIKKIKMYSALFGNKKLLNLIRILI